MALLRRLVTAPPRWLEAIALLVIVGATFARAIAGDFIWDDRKLIVDNPHIATWSKLPRGFLDIERSEDDGAIVDRSYLRPLVTASFMLDHALFGKQPWGYHLTNILLHLLVVLLAWRFARRVLGTEGRSWQAFGVATIFALHPTRAESVCWIAGRGDLLLAAFTILTLELFWRAAASEEAAPRRAVVGGWLCFAAALLCKETAVVVAPLVLATDWLLVSNKAPPVRRWLGQHIPLLLVAGLWTAVAAGRQAPTEYDLTLAQQLNIVLTSIYHYGRLLVSPYEPNAMIGAYFNPMTTWSVTAAFIAIACVAGWTAGVVLSWRRNSAVAWALSLFGLALAPTLNVIQPAIGAPALVAERYLYLPLLGVALLVVVGLSTLSSRLRATLGFVVALLCCTWIATVAVRAADFGSPLRFWSAQLSVDNDNPLAHQKLAYEHLRAGRLQRAEQHMVAALRNWVRVGRRSGLLTLQLRFVEARARATPGSQRAYLQHVEHQLAQLIGIARSAPDPARRVNLDFGAMRLSVTCTTEALAELRASLPRLRRLHSTLRQRAKTK